MTSHHCRSVRNFFQPSWPVPPPWRSSSRLREHILLSMGICMNILMKRPLEAAPARSRARDICMYFGWCILRGCFCWRQDFPDWSGQVQIVSHAAIVAITLFNQPWLVNRVIDSVVGTFIKSAFHVWFCLVALNGNGSDWEGRNFPNKIDQLLTLKPHNIFY